ncbi:MAG: hypothetical protein R3B96_00450 [Pirellulaceae bacterium]
MTHNRPQVGLSEVGRSLLERRTFLSHTLGGLSSIAAAYLLGQEQLRAAQDQRWTPQIDPAAPHQPRAGHFEARAKRVLVLFCSGACSHLDTFDYGPSFGDAMAGQCRARPT